MPFKSLASKHVKFLLLLKPPASKLPFTCRVLRLQGLAFTHLLVYLFWETYFFLCLRKHHLLHDTQSGSLLSPQSEALAAQNLRLKVVQELSRNKEFMEPFIA
eukprot:scaffold289872_cov18-Tisochrysis_lutea.AAC.1